MTRAVWKYPLPAQGPAVIQMPWDASVLTAQFQDDELQVWALVNPEAVSLEIRRFYVAQTGERMKKRPGRYLATALSANGRYVVHVFEQE